MLGYLSSSNQSPGRLPVMSVTEPTEALVTLTIVGKTYKKGKEQVKVLSRLNMTINRGDFLALMGPSGSGKTTLLNLLGGLDSPTEGELSIAGQRIDQRSSGQLTRWRASHVGFIFQFII